jgi:hypothetical protein
LGCRANLNYGRRVVVAFHSLSETFPIGTEDAGWQDEDLHRLGLNLNAVFVDFAAGEPRRI